MPSMVYHFDHLTEHGLKVIPLRENSKVPIGKGWQRDWNLEKSRERLRRFPEANLGLLLGDIIDVEGDSQHANKMLCDLIGDYPHPSYKSTRSVHHLFLTPDPKLRIVKNNQIEFRGHGHQSVLPPSQHFGVEYQWLSEIFPIPEMPPKLKTFFDKVVDGDKEATKQGQMKVWCGACRKECFLNKKRFQLELEAFRSMQNVWECQRCRTMDLRPIIRRMH